MIGRWGAASKNTKENNSNRRKQQNAEHELALPKRKRDWRAKHEACAKVRLNATEAPILSAHKSHFASSVQPPSG